MLPLARAKLRGEVHDFRAIKSSLKLHYSMIFHTIKTELSKEEIAQKSRDVEARLEDFGVTVKVSSAQAPPGSDTL